MSSAVTLPSLLLQARVSQLKPEPLSLIHLDVEPVRIRLMKCFRVQPEQDTIRILDNFGIIQQRTTFWFQTVWWFKLKSSARTADCKRLLQYRWVILVVRGVSGTRLIRIAAHSYLWKTGRHKPHFVWCLHFAFRRSNRYSGAGCNKRNKFSFVIHFFLLALGVDLDVELWKTGV